MILRTLKLARINVMQSFNSLPKLPAQNTPLGRWVLAGGFAAVALALLEFALTLSKTSASFSALYLLFACVGFYVPAGLFFGLVVGLLWAGASASVGAPLGDKLAQTVKALREDPDKDRGAASWILAGAIALGIAAIVPGAAFFVAKNFENESLAAIFLSLSSLVGALVGAVIAPIFKLVCGALFRVVPGGGTFAPRRTLVALLLVVVLPAMGTVVALLTKLSAVDAWPLWFLLLETALLSLALLVLRNTGAKTSWAAAALLSVVGLSCFALTALSLVEQQELPSAISKDSLVAKRLLNFSRKLTDGDKDGASALFAGGDCDDEDANVYPGAKEIAGNGKDDNCLGGDAALSNKGASNPTTAQTTAPAAPAFPKLNFLIITVDTLRADRLGAYGYARPTSPQMDAFAKESVMFQNAYSQAPHTPRSFPSFLTSRLPSEVSWVKEFANYPEMKDDNLTFFEVLAEAGYKTAFIGSHHYFKPERRLQQGIEDVSNENPGTIAESNSAIKGPWLIEKTKKKLGELAKSDQQFALWLHIYEPHASYMVHEGISFGKTLSDKYDGEIAFIDKYLGELFASLKEQKLDENTVVILFSDHGESFNDHGVYFHGSTLYEEILRVPFLIKVPGITPRVVKERVSLLDLFPTVVSLANAKLPEGLRGLSLVPALRGEPVDGINDRIVSSQLLPYPNLDEKHLVIIKGRHKLIHRVKPDNAFELYDLETDPTEQKNLYKVDQAATDAMLQALESFEAAQ
jgi:arylsulfatase A-like enzyme